MHHDNQSKPCDRAEQITDHTRDKRWRFGFNYQNVTLTADDGSVHIHPVEDAIWAAHNQTWPPEGHRVSFIDGNPSNVASENLKLLNSEEAAQLDRRNEDLCLSAVRQADCILKSLDNGDYLVSTAGGATFRCSGVAGLMSFVQQELKVLRWPWH